jgi:glycerol-3-phosphate dehydrogenase (NAD(P)+)
MYTNKSFKICILGDGGWGTTLAILLSQKGYQVTLWGAFPKNISDIRKTGENKKFLPGFKIPNSIRLTDDLAGAIKDKNLVVFAIPSQHLRKVLKRIKLLSRKRTTLYLSAVKGIDIESFERMSEIIHSELGNVSLAVLSGPTIACEVAKGIPTVAVIASGNIKIRKLLQDVFMTDRFRIYTSDDVIGVELGGSLKNVIAIACGACDGLGFGTNTKAAILSRGLTEISRLGIAMGAKQKTFSGISGLGDLVTTCISPYSRNRFVGEELGKGKNLKKITAHMEVVAEGVPTAKSAYLLSLRHKIDMPIVKEVYNVLYNNKTAFKAFRDLMGREKKEE